jgi:hypothetical protein
MIKYDNTFVIVILLFCILLLLVVLEPQNIYFVLGGLFGCLVLLIVNRNKSW